MNNKLLIDAAFPEEMRIAVLNEKNILESVDRETTSSRQLKGNIYLAKIIRLEPSLQAAFINYGGDKHGFLPMSDIHPDYYNIPENLKDDMTAVKFFSAQDRRCNVEEYEDKTPEEIRSAVENMYHENDGFLDNENTGSDEGEEDSERSDTGSYGGQNDCTIDDSFEEEIGGGRFNDFRRYKIEDVLREGQYLLVQVLKEERGNKGVALTTYISLAGKYSVLMVNTDGKGGISRKITNLRDRRILKNILNTLNPDNNKSIIIRTAGIGRKPEEISRDYVYLVRLWDAIKQATKDSVAPIFIHSEDDILKRTVRDLHSDKIGEIIVEGQNAFKNVKSLVRMIMPEQKTVVQNYTDKIPLFYRYKIEEQIERLYNNRVDLPSGGSLVIDQTEALVAIDVNSGKATREKSVEEMALTTNVEAAKEIARQLRLRNIGGLIVIDFIDMYENRNRRMVEKVLREQIMLDKAKIQIDRISIFGLLEMSRQRIHVGLYETVNEKCPNCDGRGTIRSRDMVINNILRSVKLASREKFVKVVYVFANNSLVNFMLNYRKNEIIGIEKNYGINVIVSGNNSMDNKFEIKKRALLTDTERKNLHPVQHMGKVNKTFDDDDLYEEKEKRTETYFADNCYYSKYDNSQLEDDDKGATGDRQQAKYGKNARNSRTFLGKNVREKGGDERVFVAKKKNGNIRERQSGNGGNLSFQKGRQQKNEGGGFFQKIKNLFSKAL
ncbi:MAG: Rne/Rng family ribonuclease [Rickettsiales bacterium]|jgi:ribonuclease E|nr:Rne/Rng family ribonuclease [Rickettsiales bacterium]